MSTPWAMDAQWWPTVRWRRVDQIVRATTATATATSATNPPGSSPPLAPVIRSIASRANHPSNNRTPPYLCSDGKNVRNEGRMTLGGQVPAGEKRR